MGVSRVDYNGETLIDLTGDSVAPETLAEGETAHAANGDPITGAMTAVQYGKAQALTDEQKAQARQNIGSASVEDLESALTDAKESGEFDGPQGDPGASGVYLGSTEPTDPTINIWIDPDGEPSGYEEWVFTLSDGSTVTKRVVVLS